MNAMCKVVLSTLVLGPITLAESRHAANEPIEEQHLWISEDSEFELVYAPEMIYTELSDQKLIDQDYDAREDLYLEEGYDWPDTTDEGTASPVQ